MEEVLAYAADVAANDPFDMRMTKLAINQALDAQGFTEHIVSAHSTYINRRLSQSDPGYALRRPAQLRQEAHADGRRSPWNATSATRSGTRSEGLARHRRRHDAHLSR